MFWPRLKLTEEEKAWVQKYTDPKKPGRGVLRRMYPGHLDLTGTIRLPSFSFQISRRCRVFGLTLSGDADRFRLEIVTSTGELHTQKPVFVPHLLPGYSQVPQGLFSAVTTPSPPWAGSYSAPYVFEPNLVLLPNQTLSFNGYETEPRPEQDAHDYRLDLTLHVWEFPGMPGSPA